MRLARHVAQILFGAWLVWLADLVVDDDPMRDQRDEQDDSQRAKDRRASLTNRRHAQF
jgi:hypothetical protein